VDVSVADPVFPPDVMTVPRARGVPASADTGISPQEVKRGELPETVWSVAAAQVLPFQYAISMDEEFVPLLAMHTRAVPVVVPAMRMS
jgi:hypothetical protein